MSRIRTLLKALDSFLTRKLPAEYAQREDATRFWLQRFGTREMERVARFLAVYCDAFLLHRRDAVRLLPKDRPMDIYRLIHADRPADQMEFETFRLRLKRRFGAEFSYEDLGRLSLEEMYERIQSITAPVHSASHATNTSQE